MLCNRPVFDVDGRHLVTPDLLDVEAGVAGEYQGEHHFHRDQRRVDVEREQRLRAAGLEYVEIMGGDTAEQVVARLRATYARAARMPAAARRWTLERPPGWIATDTVDQRRSLSRDQRRRLLGRRVLADAA